MEKPRKSDTIRSENMHCSNCGNKLTDGSKFCNKCGKTVVEHAHVKPADAQSGQRRESTGETKESSVAAVVITTIIATAIVVGVLSNIGSFSSQDSSSNHSAASSTTEVSSQPPAQSDSNSVSPNTTNSAQITAADIAPYLTGVVEVLCKRMDTNRIEQINDTGSGSLWKFPNGTYDVVTNEHVIAGNDRCILWIPNPNGAQKGTYYLDLLNVRNWNSIADEAVVPILSSLANGSNPEGVGIYNIPINQLNYSVSSLRDCPSGMPQGSPVTVVGYPAFSSIDAQGNPQGAFKNQITTNGIISGNYSLPKNSRLPYSNYYISATIDSGNSGGVAFSKDQNGLCLLGIPTWVTTGNYANEGVVQNIRNVSWVDPN